VSVVPARIRDAWLLLDAQLRGFYLLNLLGLGVSILALSGWAVLGGVGEPVTTELAAMVVALAVLLVAAALTPYGGAPLLAFALIVSTNVFAATAAWVTPFLAPLIVLVQLVPVLAVSHVTAGHRLLVLGVTLVVVPSTVVVAELRRDRVPPVDATVAATFLGVFMPIVLVLLLVELGRQYQRFRDQASSLRESRSRIVTVADAARRGLERDLHDGAQQRLVANSFLLEHLAGLVQRRRHDEAAELIDRVAEQNRSAMQELRRLAHGIYPSVLTDSGIVAAVRDAARRSPVPVEVLTSEIPRQREDVEAAAYFAILEALQNVAKHSGATRATVRIAADPRLEFSVTDDGVGFDPAGVAGAPAGGLLGTDARLAAVGARLEVISRPGEGTTIRGTF
jgi:signal transduction histidine kinase